MRVRWTRGAIADLTAIRKYVARSDPDAAKRLGARLRSAAERLVEHPASGRAGRIPETRELVVAGTPYFMPYRIRGEDIQILRVIHGARAWPDEA